MNPKSRSMFVIIIVMLSVVLVSSVKAQSDGPEAPAAGLSSAFTFQGVLQRQGAPFTGTCDMQFSLWNSAAAGSRPGAAPAQPSATLAVTGISIANGVFAVRLDFGNQFTGQSHSVEPAVKCASDTSFTTLPRVPLDAAPYAIGLMPGATVNGDIPYGSGDATFKATNASASDGTALFGNATATSGATAGVFGVSNSPAGAGVWGKNPNFVGVLGQSDSHIGVAGNSATGTAVEGTSQSGAGVIGTSDSWVGVYGQSSSFSGVWGKSTSGTGAAGESTDYYGVYGVSENHDGVHGVSHEPNKAGVAGINDAVGGIGVYGGTPNGGLAGWFDGEVRANGDATQGLNDSGWIKAMVHVDYRLPPGSQITKCFNSQASGVTVHFPPCGFSVQAIQNGYWDVDFGFDVSARFIQATVWNPTISGGCSGPACETRTIELRPQSDGSIVGVTISYNQSGAQTNAPFTLIVY